MTPIETLTFDGSFTARIFPDKGVERPYARDEATRIVVLNRLYDDPSKGACGRDLDELAAWERENADGWFTIPLFLYDFVRMNYRVGQNNPFGCPWYSARVGIIALRLDSWDDSEDADMTLTEVAEAIAKEYSAWANGECYRFELFDEAGNELDAWWGFIGLERAREQAAKCAARHAAQNDESGGAS